MEDSLGQQAHAYVMVITYKVVKGYKVSTAYSSPASTCAGEKDAHAIFHCKEISEKVTERPWQSAFLIPNKLYKFQCGAAQEQLKESLIQMTP